MFKLFKYISSLTRFLCLEKLRYYTLILKSLGNLTRIQLPGRCNQGPVIARGKIGKNRLFEKSFCLQCNGRPLRCNLGKIVVPSVPMYPLEDASKGESLKKQSHFITVLVTLIFDFVEKDCTFLCFQIYLLVF